MAPSVYLHSHDVTQQLYVEHDASKDGWGGVLYQLDDQGRKRVLQFCSGRWKPNEIGLPPYYLELVGMMHTLNKCKRFINSNNHIVKARGDHQPLRWLKNSTRTWVRRILLDEMEVDFEWEYLKGTDNVIADALSRYPMLGPMVLRDSGVAATLDIVLPKLPDSIKSMPVWCWAQTDAPGLVSHFRQPRNSELLNSRYTISKPT